MCQKIKKDVFVENLSADTVANKTKTPFERIYTVVLNKNASGKDKKHIKTERFKKGIPYLVWATDITQGSVKIREVVGGKAPVEVMTTDCRFTSAPQIEIGGQLYKEKIINGIYHYLPLSKFK